MNKTIETNKDVTQTFTKYGLPNGSLWACHTTEGDITYLSVADTKENARNTFSSKLDVELEGISGVGKTTLDAQNACHKAYTLNQVLSSYSSQAKNPMLVVGANNWLREKVPYFVLQQFDLHLQFFPNNSNYWIIGITALSKMNPIAKPIRSYGISQDVQVCSQECIYDLLAKIISVGENLETFETHGEKRLVWETMNLYRSPKIALKDVLILETYPSFVIEETFENFTIDGLNVCYIKSEETKISFEPRYLLGGLK